MKIGFIGCGNMATAIIDGIIKSESVKASDVYCFDIYSPAVDKLVEKYQVNKCSSENDVAEQVDIVVLAVKPNVLADVLQKINYTLENNNSLVISIAAGKSIEFIRSNLTHKAKIIRVMPNINAVVGEAIIAYTANDSVSEDEKAVTESIFSSVGKVLYIDESAFALFGVLGGCSPAFAYMFIDALARAGVKNGMKKDTALMICAQAVYGSAKMILESNEHPWELIDKVCSPGGTTIEGVTSLQADGFENAIHNAVDKALEKDSRL